MAVAKYALFGGAWLMGVCCAKMVVDAAKRPAPTPPLTVAAKPVPSLTSAMQIADTLDAYVQPRFAMLDNKNFGITRMVLPKHANVVHLRVDTQAEKEQMARINAAKHDYSIQMLHCAPVPGNDAKRVTPALQLLYFEPQPTARDKFGRITFLKWAEKIGLNCKAIESKAVMALPQLRAGKENRTEEGSWHVLMRPVQASKPECLSCHTTAKLGATLGVMVYAVRQTTRRKAADAQTIAAAGHGD